LKLKFNTYFNTPPLKFKAEITISGSKSESNRLLILQQLVTGLVIENCSDSDDSQHLKKALASKKSLIDIGHAGTAMRFLTAYFSIQENREVVLTGSKRMQNRPIGILVNALRDLGAEISYENKEGYPPIRIKGKNVHKNMVQIEGNVSSQYISALLLIAASLPNGLEIELLGEITSVPYINMTLSLLNQLAIETSFVGSKIKVYPKKTSEKKTIIVESDWSSASYFYSIVALSDIGSEITLSSYNKSSLQGDACLAEMYQHFGVKTTFYAQQIILKKEVFIPSSFSQNLKDAPDIAQTIAVTCFGLGLSCDLSGLHTLKIKETDRLVALEKELTKLGAEIYVTNDSLHLKPRIKINKNCTIKTYKDHRMAMAFAPLAIKVPIEILEAEVVTKSYRTFWNDLQQIGFEIN